MAGTPKKHYYHIDMMRFVFSVIIVYFHILNASIIPHVSDPRYKELAGTVSVARIVVVYFFIISGLFLYRSFRANPGQSIFEYIVGRIVRLWPVLMLAVVLEALLSGQGTWQRILLNGSFLQCSGLSLEYKGILWYVSSFFFASIFLYAILRSCSGRTAAILISLLSYFGMTLLINYYEGKIGGRETVFYVINMGVVRGVTFVGMGILAAMVFEKLQEMTRLAPLSPGAQKVLFGGKLLAELGTVAALYAYFVVDGESGNYTVLVLTFLAALLAMVSEKDPMGMVLNRKIFGFLGKYAYSIYVMQETSFLVMKKTIWRSEPLLSHVGLTLVLSTACSLALGIAVYHLVEKPFADLYYKWYKRYKAALAERNA